MSRRVLVAALAAALGCAPEPPEMGPGQTPEDDGKQDDPVGPNDPPPPGTRAMLEVHAMDLWAQYLPADAGAAMTITRDGIAVAAPGFPVARLALVEAGTYTVTLGAPDHESLSVTFDYDGSRDAAGLAARPFSGAGRAGLSVAHAVTGTPDGGLVAVHSVYLGLRHRWFSASGRPARRGNRVELLMDGVEAFARVRGDLEAATDTIHIATWWWESDFELTRPWATHATMSAEARRQNTILSILDESPAQKRVIVGQFVSQDGALSNMTSDAALRAMGAAAGDGFEYMGQANETSGKFLFAVEPFAFGDRVRGAAGTAATAAQFDAEAPVTSTIPARMVDLTEMPTGLEVNHASYHQKFMVIDDDVAFVGGMNLRRTDFDSSDHLVFDHRRMLFGATTDERLAVQDQLELPDQGPRKDYMVRVEGPAAQDAADVFQRRWDLLRAEGVAYSSTTTPFEVARDLPAQAGGAQVQMTATLPDPLWEHAIAETWLNAVANATDTIYIEDQYFRAPLLTEAILARMAEVPGLRLVVITKPINEWTDPGCAQTYLANSAIAAVYPDRYLLLQLRSFDSVVTWGWDETESRFADIDTHSKMLIIDDAFLSVGSANKNNRGMIYEGEMNVAVLDRAWVRAARERIVANLLGYAPSGDWWAELAAAADWNGWVAANWDAAGGDISLDGAPLPVEYTPSGFVYPLAFGSLSDCLIEDVGEDMFKPATDGKPAY